MTDLADMVADWAEWAAQIVDTWPDDPSEAEPDWHSLEEIADRAHHSPAVT
jgi:hypothetical protein